MLTLARMLSSYATLREFFTHSMSNMHSTSNTLCQNPLKNTHSGTFIEHLDTNPGIMHARTHRGRVKLHVDYMTLYSFISDTLTVLHQDFDSSESIPQREVLFSNGGSPGFYPGRRGSGETRRPAE